MRSLFLAAWIALVAFPFSALAVDTIVQPTQSGGAPHLLLSGGKLTPIQVVMTSDGSGALVPASSGGVTTSNLPPGVTGVTAYVELVASAPVTDGDTITVTAGAHAETLTFRNSPSLPNDVLIGGSTVPDTVTKLQSLFSVAEVVVTQPSGLTIRITAGSNYPGALGNTSVRLQESSTSLSVVHGDGSGYATGGVTATTGALAAYARQPVPLSSVDTFTATGNGLAVDGSALGLKYYSIAVKGTGGSATSWDIKLECSLDGVNFSTILSHGTADLDGVTKAHPTASACLYIRSRVASLVLAPASNVVVTILGMN